MASNCLRSIILLRYSFQAAGLARIRNNTIGSIPGVARIRNNNVGSNNGNWKKGDSTLDLLFFKSIKVLRL